MIAYLLTLFILPIFLYVFRVWHASRLVALALVGAGSLALAFVWAPELATKLAHGLGVGRGADLVLYMYGLVSFLLILDLSLKLKSQNQVITRLAREIAIERAFCETEREGP